ncbi:hypothetical protein [Mycobacterium sp. 1274756.6]|uniref:hypothetical protein n=1 Tax=Mycobacterium sp. 1274756.6 TaxID=1834076 RepID=UPI0007FDD1EE|nr:hypothetical protein [Mycobacterium sp. 1274756.6]OBJ67442.1 hypothetical protein A5643_16945 [Mycobacterium sp. 1274756.6]
MEDQQHGPGDLSDDDAETASDATAAETPESETEPAESETGAGEAADGQPESTSDAEEPATESADGSAAPAGPSRSARLRAALPAVGLGAAATVFVAAAAAAGAAVQPYLADRALVDTKLAIARSASDAIRTLWTYTPETISSLPDRAAEYLTGDLAANYRKYIEAIEPRYIQAQVSLDSEVVGVAVSAVEDTDASALVYTNTSWSSPKTKDIPGLQYNAYQVALVRDGARWRVTALEPITNFTLTPQF